MNRKTLYCLMIPLFLFTLTIVFSFAGFLILERTALFALFACSLIFLGKARRVATRFSPAWLLYAVSFLLWAAFHGVALGFSLFASAAGIPLQLSLLTAVLPSVPLLIAVVYVSVDRRRKWPKIQYLADLLAIFIAFSGFLYFIFIETRFLESAGTIREMAPFVLIFVVNNLVLIFSLSIISIVRLSKDRVSVLCFLLSFVTSALGNLLFASKALIGLAYGAPLLSAIQALSPALALSGAILFRLSPKAMEYSDDDIKTVKGSINRSLVLLAMPVLVLVLKPVRLNEIVFFSVTILLHQFVTQLLRRMFLLDSEFTETARVNSFLEATIQDRTRELKIMNQTLENLLKRDAITGQYNRKYFMEYTDEAVQTAGDDDRVWMFLLDFDRFKSINDTYGHDTGDQVLRIIGRRLESLSGEQTVVARLGGDEFGIIAFRNKTEPISRFLHSILKQYETPVRIGMFSIHVAVSIGVSVWPDDATNRTDLMRHADVALYVAKKNHNTSYAFFDLNTNAVIARKHQIDLALKKTVIEDEFRLVYQPQFAVGSGRLIGMEALVRWNNPELGAVQPDDFIQVAEENGFIIPLSEWIFRKAMETVNRWNRAYGKHLVMGINVSPIHLEDTNFLSRFKSLLIELDIQPSWVNLEITEHFAMTDDAYVVRLFDELSEMGVMTSIDDFGTGYSSLSYLKRYSINYLKIAKQLIDGIAENETDFQLVQAIIMMATALNLRTIAEGVEDEKQYRKLESLGCDEIQGFYFGRPVDPEEFEELHLKG